VKHEKGTSSRLRAAVLSLLTIGLLAAAATATTAAASNPLEGVWSFNGGRIAIHSEAGSSSLVGTVIAPTTFAACPHEVGEEIWTGIAAQSDGSYWGRHQWFYEDGSCTRNPELGPTAFRVISSGSGRYLRVCLSEPGGAQPTIRTDGTSSGATYGCVNSELIAGLPTSADLKASNLIDLRSNAACVASRRLRVRIHDPHGDKIVNATVTVRGGGVLHRVKVKMLADGDVAIVRPRSIPSDTFVVSVTLETALGHTIKTKRTYRSCVVTKGTHKVQQKNG
jgi:hypothetical protein